MKHDPENTSFPVGVVRPIVFETPDRLTEIVSWHGHIPFAFWLIDAIRPRVLVELGTHKGDSYCAFAQAVDRLQLDTACYAIDTWRGDRHAGFYGEEVLAELRQYHDPRYGRFSRLMRSTFDDAVGEFADRSLDLLHVDGMHTYEAVKHDFETWRPKLSKRGVVVFHDIDVRESDFGVWRLWDEVTRDFPSFAFHHSHGLGVLAVGAEVADSIGRLTRYNEPESAQVRGFFSGLGGELLHRSEGATTAHHLADAWEQLLLTGLRNEELERELAEVQGDNQRRSAMGESLRSENAAVREALAKREMELLAAHENLRESRLQCERFERELTDLGGENHRLIASANSLRNENTVLQARLQQSTSVYFGLLEETHRLWRSGSWRLLRPVRNLIRRRHGHHDEAEPSPASPSEALRTVVTIRDSLSWELTAPLRLLHRIVGRKRTLSDLSPSPPDVGSQGMPVQREGDPSAELAKRHAMDSFEYQPLISIVTPVYNIDEVWLRRCVDSVRAQLYSRWELCLVNDASDMPHIRQILDGYSVLDKRIKVKHLDKNQGISGASNQALEMATGEFVGLLDHDDEITHDALFEVVRVLNADRSVDVAYSDEDKFDLTGNLCEPFHKPDWSPQFFRYVMYVGHFLVMRRTLIIDSGGFNPRFDKLQDYELMLRVSERTSAIHHIPKILYHWRQLPGSIALGTAEKGKVESIQAAAVNEHLRRLGIHAVAAPHPKFAHRAVIRPLPRHEFPKVSIIIPSRDAPDHIGTCLGSIFGKSTYKHYEVVVVDNGTTDPRAIKVLKKYPIKVIPYQEKFNFSRANNLGMCAAEGEYAVLLNNDTEVVTPDWIEQMLFLLEQKNIAAVGPLLIYPNGKVQHAGVVLGFRGTADHVMRGFAADSDGYAGSLSCPREVSAVTGACLMIRKCEYLELGGLEEHYGTIYQDVDLCLKIRATGKSILFAPTAVLVHHENATRGNFYDHLDRALLLESWGDVIGRGDPYFNPNFSLSRHDYSLADLE